MDIISFEILFLITIVVFTIVGGLVGWFYGYKTGFSNAVREGDEFIGRLYAGGWLPSEVFCTQCKATMPYHYHGCSIAAEWRLVTIAKPGG